MVNETPNDSKHAPFYAPGDESVSFSLLSLIYNDFFDIDSSGSFGLNLKPWNRPQRIASCARPNASL